jgi:hypothetical protein
MNIVKNGLTNLKTNKIMEREDEIVILIEYLKEDVIKTSQRYSNLLSDTIIRNGKLIESYKIELKEIKEK